MSGMSFIVGPAASGKSNLVSALLQISKDSEKKTISLNLDPGVMHIPYKPDIDIRNYIDINEVTDKYGLGPNGTLLLTMDLATSFIDKINREIDDINPDHIIVDTSGQMELFAYRASGLFMSETLKADNKCIIFLLDSIFCQDPRNFLTSVLLSTSVHFRFMYPVINVLNKIDLVSKEILNREINWTKNRDILTDEIYDNVKGDEASHLIELNKFLAKSVGNPWFIPVSSHTLENMTQLIASISRLLFAGDDIF